MARAAREEGEGGTDLRQVDFSLFSFSVDFNIVNGYNLSRERILERADRNTFLYDPEHRLLFCRNAKVESTSKTTFFQMQTFITEYLDFVDSICPF